uniref:Uncharacterized protein n=1 Tax=Catharus ustulatus TaxID=91951 RepID=A0A8C3U9Z9_CATUS
GNCRELSELLGILGIVGNCQKLLEIVGNWCYRRWNEDGSSSCVQCRNGTADCRDGELRSRGSSSALNLSTATPQILTLGGPEVAASLILGTFCLSLFLILSVASFFYLKRANKLPQVFYRRNKENSPILCQQIPIILSRKFPNFEEKIPHFVPINSLFCGGNSQFCGGNFHNFVEKIAIFCGENSPVLWGKFSSFIPINSHFVLINSPISRILHPINSPNGILEHFGWIWGQ